MTQKENFVTCINHPKDDPLIIIQKWQVIACNKNLCAAAIISAIQIENCKRQISIPLRCAETINRKMIGLYSLDTIRSALKLLVELDYLELNKFTEKEAKNICSSKRPQNLALGDKTCEWCDSKTLILHQHHYPTPKAEGGKDVVNICASCHAEFHHLLSNSFYRETEFLIGLLEANPLPSHVKQLTGLTE